MKKMWRWQELNLVSCGLKLILRTAQHTHDPLVQLAILAGIFHLEGKTTIKIVPVNYPFYGHCQWNMPLSIFFLPVSMINISHRDNFFLWKNIRNAENQTWGPQVWFSAFPPLVSWFQPLIPFSPLSHHSFQLIFGSNLLYVWKFRPKIQLIVTYIKFS